MRFSNHTDPPRAGLRERAPPCACCQRGRCLCLAMFIKMATVSHLNVNYCYDTQDNLTCFSNLFFLVIRCRNWKIFQSVTTVRKVRWQRGSFPTGSHPGSCGSLFNWQSRGRPVPGTEMVLLEPSRWHLRPLRAG